MNQFIKFNEEKEEDKEQTTEATSNIATRASNKTMLSQLLGKQYEIFETHNNCHSSTLGKTLYPHPITCDHIPA